MVSEKKIGMSIALMVALSLFVGISFYLNTSHDDAFISFRYAENLIEGNGMVFNIGDRVEGYTNFLWIVLLSILMKAGFDIVMVSKVLGILSGVLTLCLIYRFSNREHGKGGFLNLMAVFFTAINVSFIYWDSSGLETNFFAFLVVWGVLRKIEESKGKEGLPASSILLALASMARPEGILVFGSLVLFETISSYREEKTFSPNLKALGLFLLVFLPYFFWRYHYFGYPLPNTFYAKTGGGLSQVRRGVIYTVGFLLLYGVLPFLPGILLFFKKVRKPWHILVLTVVILYTFYIITVGGDHMILYRFFVPILPLIFLLTQEGLRATHELFGLKRGTVVLTFLVLLCLTLIPYGSKQRGKNYALRDQIYTWIELGEWFRENASPDETIALGAAGAIPYYSGLRTIDYYGLIDTHIAHTESRYSGRGFAGHDKGDAKYLLSLKPDYIIPYPKLALEPAMKAEDLDKLFIHGPQRDVWNDPEFRENYEVMNARLEGGYVGFFKRKK